MASFEFLSGEKGDANLSKLLILTILLSIPPFGQTLYLTLLKFRHPIIEDVGYDGIETRPLYKAWRCFERTLRSLFGIERMRKEVGGYKWQETMKSWLT